MNYIFPISSERIDYLPLTKVDVAKWTPFFENNPMLQYLGIGKPSSAEEEAIKWVDRQLTRYKENGWGFLKMIHKETGEMVGHTGLLLRMIEGEEFIEIGYSIMPKFWRMGYGSEASQRMKAYMKEHKVRDKVISIIHTENIGSQKVAEKNGMTRGRTWEFLGMPVYIYGSDL